MTLKELDLQNRVWGETPEGFRRSVQCALRRTQEEPPVKKLTIRTAALVMALIALAGVAFAAIVSNTADYFGTFYGEEWKTAALNGDIDSSKPSVQVGDLIYTMDDVIVTGITLDNEGMTVDDGMCSYILATGTIRPAENANVVVMPEDYLVSDPWNYNPYYNGREGIPAGTPTVLEKAAESGAVILCARATANGLVDAKGDVIPCDVGYTGIQHEDGSLVFSMEIQLMEPIPRQDAYTLSVYVANHEVSAADEHLMDTRQAQDWVFAIQPSSAGK